MARELQNINSSGELTEIKLGGTADGDKVLTSDEVDVKDATVLSTANTYTDDAIDAINESWGVITALDQEPNVSMKVGDYMTTAVTGTLINFDSIVVTTGQTVVKTGETTWGVFTSGYDYNYFTVPYSGARTDVDLGDKNLTAEEVYINYVLKINTLDPFPITDFNDCLWLGSSETTSYINSQGAERANKPLSFNASLFTFNNYIQTTQLRVSSLNTAPSTSSDTGTTGEIRITADYIYICVATDTWKRVAISTW